jgi:hypothetical protein
MTTVSTMPCAAATVLLESRLGSGARSHDQIRPAATNT